MPKFITVFRWLLAATIAAALIFYFREPIGQALLWLVAHLLVFLAAGAP